MDINYKIQQFIKEFTKEKLVKKYLYSRTWLSGSSTTVYPITVWKREIVCQWKSDKRIFDTFINRIVEKHSDLFNYGYFYKTDGSCPSALIFRFKEE